MKWSVSPKDEGNLLMTRLVCFLRIGPFHSSHFDMWHTVVNDQINNGPVLFSVK